MKPKRKEQMPLFAIIVVRCIIGAVIGWTIGRLLSHLAWKHQDRQLRRMKKHADEQIARVHLTLSRL